MLRVYYMMQATKINEDIATTRWINEGLNALDAFETSGQTGEALAFAKVSAELLRKSYRPIKIHRYYPRSILGGDFGMLDFQLGTIFGMIEEGEKVALTHDCEESECLV
jgi:hypothetical protein